MPPFRSRHLRWVPPLAWMTMIFVGSTDVLAADHTSRLIEPFLRWLSHDSLSPQRIEEIHFLIRKGGHFCEYAVLCVLLWWALPSPVHPPWSTVRRAPLAVCLAALFAASDEFHQSFVPTRGASVRDVLIDTTGAVFGILLLLAARSSIRWFRSRQLRSPR